MTKMAMLAQERGDREEYDSCVEAANQCRLSKVKGGIAGGRTDIGIAALRQTLNCYAIGRKCGRPQFG